MTRNNDSRGERTTRIGPMTVTSLPNIDIPFVCMECEFRFRTVEAAERAAFGDKGCPRCGSSDIDLDGHRPRRGGSL